MNTLIEGKTFSIKILIYSHARPLQLGVLLIQQGTVQLIIFTDKKRRQHMRLCSSFWFCTHFREDRCNRRGNTCIVTFLLRPRDNVCFRMSLAFDNYEVNFLLLI